MNKTLLGKKRSMLNFEGLSSSYWAEVVHVVVYLRNPLLLWMESPHIKYGMVSVF